MTPDVVFTFDTNAPEVVTKATKALDSLRAAVAATGGDLEKYGKASGSAAGLLAKDAGKLRNATNELQKTADEISRASGAVPARFTGQVKQLQDMAKALEDSTAALDSALTRIGGAKRVLNRSGNAADVIAKWSAEANAATNDYQKALSDAQAVVARFDEFSKKQAAKKPPKPPKVDLGQEGLKQAVAGLKVESGAALVAMADADKKLEDAAERAARSERDRYTAWWNERLQFDKDNLNRIKFNLAEGNRLIVGGAMESLAKQKSASAALESAKSTAQKAADQAERDRYAAWWNEAKRRDQDNLNRIKFNLAEGNRLIVGGAMESLAKQKEIDAKALAKQKEADQERLALQRQTTAERLSVARADAAAVLAAEEASNKAVLRMISQGIGDDYDRDQKAKAGPSAGELATSTKQARDRADELARSLRGVSIEANTLHSASRGLASGFNMLWLTWGEMLPLLAGAAVSFGTAFSVKMGAQVDHTLQTIRVLSGETQEAVAGLNDQLLQLASTGPVGPLEVAEAMKTLSLAGMSASGVSVAIKDVMNFAVAGTTDLKQAADVMTSVATAFNVSAEGFNYVGDVIAKTAAVSKASVESVGEAFKTASVIHKQFGVSLEDAGVGIAALANLGIQGTAAGTALRNMYNDLSGRTPKVTAALKQLNVELRDQNGKFKDLVTLTMEFDKGLSRLKGKAQKDALLEVLSERGGKPMIELREMMISEEKIAREFAKRSGQAVVEGFEEGVKSRLQRMRDSIGDSAGFQIQASIQLSETPLKQMETAVSALQSALVSAFGSVKSEVVGVAVAMQDLFRSDAFKTSIETLLSLTMNLVGGLVTLAKFATENAGILTTLAGVYIGLRVATGNYLEILTLATQAKVLFTARSFAAAAAVTAETVAQGPLAVQKAIATRATNVDTFATNANTASKYAGITAAGLFAKALPFLGTALAVAAGAWMLYQTLVGSSTDAMEAAAESTASDRRVEKLKEETARLRENTEAMLANMTVDQLRSSKALKADNTDTGRLRAERDRAAKQATELMDLFEKTNGGGSEQAAVVLQAKITKAVNDTTKAETALTAALVVKDKVSTKERQALEENIEITRAAAEATKARQGIIQAAMKTGSDDFLRGGRDKNGKTAKEAQNALDNDLRYNRLDEIAKANKTELDGLRSRLNSEAEALKDFRDANMVQEGEYQSRITSITMDGEKAQKAAAIAGWLDYAAEIDRLLTGLAAMPKTKISDSDKENRVQELNAKLLNAAEAFNNDMAKIDEEATKRERRLYTDQYKELDKLRKSNETAIANSKDRVQALMDEQEMADKTLGLGGVDLEATQARLKIELEGKKELRKFDLETTAKLQASAKLRADAEAAADDEAWEAKHRRADDFDAQLRELVKGRANLEVQLQTEAAVTVAAVYRKEFKRRTDEIGDELTGSLVDALMAGGKEGGQRLRKLLQKELLSAPLTAAIRVLVQPFAQAMAGLSTPGANGAPSALSQAMGGNYVAGFSQLANTSFGASVGLSQNMFEGLPGMEGYSYYQTTQLGSQVGKFVQTAGDVLGYANALNTAFSKNAQGGRDYGRAGGQALGTYFGGPLGSLIGGEIGSALGLVDYSGTMHTGGLGSYSKAGGAAYGDTVKGQGLDFNLSSNDYKAQTEQASIAISAAVATMLDTTAGTFGQKVGYYAATAFADDISPDGAWGALMVRLGDRVITDWKGGNDKWPGREFADGETGAKEYAAAIAKDMRDYLITQTPDWADNMLRALGDAPTLDGVVETAGKINQAAKMLTAMGRDKMTDTGAAAFEQLKEQYGWWNAEQQAQIAILNAQGKSQEALNRQRELDIALLSEDEKAARRRVFVLEDQVALATEQASLQQRLNEATKTRTELLALERAQVLPGNQALFDRVVAAEAVKEAEEALTSALEDLVSNLSTAIDDFKQLGDSLSDYKVSLSVAKLSPQEAYKATKAAFEQNQVKALTGDKEALGKVESLGDAFLESSKNYYASSQTYFEDLKKVSGGVDLAIAEAKRQELTATQAKTDAEKQLEALGYVKTSVDSVEDATRAVQAAVLQLAGASAMETYSKLVSSGSSPLAAYNQAAVSINNSAMTEVEKQSALSPIKSSAVTDSATYAMKAYDAAISAGKTNIQAATSVRDYLQSSSSLLTKPQMEAAFAPVRTKATEAVTADTGYLSKVAALEAVRDPLVAAAERAALHLKGNGTADVYGSTAGQYNPVTGKYNKLDYWQQTEIAFYRDGIGTSQGFFGTPYDPRNDYWTQKSEFEAYLGMHTKARLGAVNSAIDAVNAHLNQKNNLTALKFAKGGAFTNGIVSKPTMFNMGQMGEAGSEAIMPLSRMPNGSLGVAAMGANNDELVAELRALRAEVAELKQHAAANVRVAQAVGKAQIEALEVIADASTDSAKSQRLMELAR